MNLDGETFIFGNKRSILCPTSEALIKKLVSENMFFPPQKENYACLQLLLQHAKPLNSQTNKEDIQIGSGLETDDNLDYEELFHKLRKLVKTEDKEKSSSTNIVKECDGFKTSQMLDEEESSGTPSTEKYIENARFISEEAEMKSNQGYIYVLQLEDDHFYVGHDSKSIEEIYSWFTERDCKIPLWCRKYPPKKLVFYKEGTEDDCNDLVIYLMRKYGWWKVRGGRWSTDKIKMPEELLEIGERGEPLVNLVDIDLGVNLSPSFVEQKLCSCGDHWTFACQFVDPDRYLADQEDN